MSDNISITSVRSFLTVVKYMNVNKAAEELYISQPALSLSIKRLENELGINLFIRIGNKLELSDDGERILPYFQHFKDAHDALLEKADTMNGTTVQPIITIAFTGSSHTFTSLVSQRFDQAIKDVIIQFCYVERPSAVAMLKKNQADMIVSALPIYDSSLDSIRILSEPIGIVVNKKNTLSKEAKISIDVLTKLKFHGISKPSNFRTDCDECLKDRNISVTYVSESSDTAYYNIILNSDDNMAFFATEKVYESTFAPLLKYRYIPIMPNPIYRTTDLYFSKNNHLKAEPKQIAAAIRDVLVNH